MVSVYHPDRNMTPDQYRSYFADLMKAWTPRKDKMEDWYKLISQNDDDKVSGLEFVVTNEPRTLYNMALFLLTPEVVPYNIPVSGVSTTIQDAVSSVESFITRKWTELNKQSFRKGQSGSWLHFFNSIMLATGWYSVFAIATGDEFIADIWSPAQTFPDFDDSGLTEVLHAYRQSASGARKKVAQNGWGNRVTINSNIPVDVYDYWDYCPDGHVRNCVMIANQIAKEECYPLLEEIPVFVSPVGGLPDRGILIEDEITDNSWRAHAGESIVATNEQVFKNYNRKLTFQQQILRDIAQPRIIERTKSGGVVTEENWDKRGAIYHLDVDEDIHTLAMQGLPPEITTTLQIDQGQLQRGGFDFSLYSGGQESGYAQSLTSAHAQQILKAFKDNRDFVISSISNMWVKCIQIGMAKPKDFVIPTAFPDGALFETNIKISVPGDLIQRATTARQVNPNFSISTPTTMDLLFPEIRDPNKEIILSRTDQAIKNPIFASLDTIAALLDQADALQAEGNIRQSQLYRTYAQKLQDSLSGEVPNGNNQQQLPPGPPGQINAAQ